PPRPPLRQPDRAGGNDLHRGGDRGTEWPEHDKVQRARPASRLGRQPAARRRAGQRGRRDYRPDLDRHARRLSHRRGSEPQPHRAPAGHDQGPHGRHSRRRSGSDHPAAL
ncbi:MAG: hypothetical protein AVDCRST_MAG88-3219, partial [uncultured Thermomicrobiales bacterium]